MEELSMKDYEAGLKSLASKSGRNTEKGVCSVSKAGRTSGERHVCMACGYTWEGRKDDGLPATCPSCRSSLWNANTLHRHTCARCGHKWMSRKDHPIRCPSCRTKTWDQWSKTYECSECGYTEEVVQGSKVPSACPRCGSDSWGYDYVRCECKRCGYIGLYKPGRPGRCPVCKTTVSIIKDGPRVKTAKARTPEITDEVADLLIRSDSVNRDQCISSLMEHGINAEEAEIMLRFVGGDDEIAIARDMDLAYGRVAGVIRSLRGRVFI